MPAKDRYHDTVIHALVKDGWTITGEQVKLIIDKRTVFVDIEANNASSNLIILVEVKELDDVDSPIEALANAVGKYLMYRVALDDAQSDLPLFMAVTQAAYAGILNEKVGRLLLRRAEIALLVFDSEREEIVTWIP